MIDEQGEYLTRFTNIHEHITQGEAGISTDSPIQLGSGFVAGGHAGIGSQITPRSAPGCHAAGERIHLHPVWCLRESG